MSFRSTVLGLSSLILILFASCGADTPAESSVDSVSLWARVGHSREFEIAAIKEWNSSRGAELGIQIDAKFYGTDYQEVLKLAEATGALPDLFKTQSDLTEYLDKDLVEPFDSFTGSAELIDRYRSYLVENLHVFDNHVYTIPNVASTFRLIVNMDILREVGFGQPPTDWEGVLEVTEAVRAKNNPDLHGIIFPLGWGPNGQSFWKIGMIYGFSNTHGFENWYDRDSGRYNFSALNPVLEFARRIQSQDSYMPFPELLDNDQARAEFASGKAAFIFGASWDFGVYTQQFPIEERFEWVVMEFPGSEEFGTPMSVGSRLVSVISKNANSEDAFTVMKDYVYADNLLADGFSEGLYLPILPEITRNAKDNTAEQWLGFAPTIRDRSETPIPDAKLAVEGLLWPEVFMMLWNNPDMELTGTLSGLDSRYNAALSRAISDGEIDLSHY